MHVYLYELGCMEFLLVLYETEEQGEVEKVYLGMWVLLENISLITECLFLENF